jgi:hypothetical protein
LISKQQALEYNTKESLLMRYIDSQLLLYCGRILEFSVEAHSQELLDKLMPLYQENGWEIKQINRKKTSWSSKHRYWRVK